MTMATYTKNIFSLFRFALLLTEFSIYLNYNCGGENMDSLDYKILSVLKENSRVNATNIGAEVNLSTSR